VYDFLSPSLFPWCPRLSERFFRSLISFLCFFGEGSLRSCTRLCDSHRVVFSFPFRGCDPNLLRLYSSPASFSLAFSFYSMDLLRSRALRSGPWSYSFSSPGNVASAAIVATHGVALSPCCRSELARRTMIPSVLQAALFRRCFFSSFPASCNLHLRLF